MAANATLTVPPHVLTYLTEQKTLTLATASTSGVPHAATLTFVNDGVTLYVWTRPDATTAGHIEQNSMVAFAIDEYAADWRQTKGIQGAGEARVLLNADDIRRVVGLFEQKFASVSASGESNISFFRITPAEIRFIEGASGTEGSDQALGFDYHRDLVYSVFHDLPPGEVSATLGASLQVVQAPAGTVIVRQGAPADKFFIVVDGEVEVVREDAGERRTVARLRARPVLRRDGDPARHAAHRDGAGDCRDHPVRHGARRLPLSRRPVARHHAGLRPDDPAAARRDRGERLASRDGDAPRTRPKPRRSAAPTSGAPWGPSRPV